ncbi:unknown [Clostridium sp. CAG:343]|nr:unknown [Clostridium sp. CAG:343]
MEEKKNIEVVSGDGSNLEISPVYDHLNVSTPKSAEKKPKYVVIPEEKKKKEKYEDKKEEEN